MKETSPYGETVAGILVILFGALIGLRTDKVWWDRHASPVEPWQSQALFCVCFLGGLFLVAHAIVRKIR